MKEIAAALVRAQKEFGPALKTSSNPHFRTKYAALDACVEAVIDGLNNNGIMLMQQTHLCEDGVIVETTFIHESGEVMSGGKIHIPAAKQDPQGFGSALTYARRYSLQAACGIAPEDDDANKATAAVQQRKAAPVKQPEPAKQVAQEAPKPANAPAKVEGKEGSWQIKIDADPDLDFDSWAKLVLEMTQMALSQASDEASVMSIFRTNKNIYDQLKQDSGSYDELLAMFKKEKAKYQKASEE